MSQVLGVKENEGAKIIHNGDLKMVPRYQVAIQ